MIRVVFDPQAEREAREAAFYYEGARKGLGERFLNEIEFSIKQIKQYPLIWRKLSKNFRRCIVKDFPYSIIYSARKNEIYIIAVMHLKREPGYWLERNQNH